MYVFMYGWMGGWCIIIACMAAETLGFTSYPPAYLSPQASGKNLLIGANFASAASGYYDKTAYFYVSHSLLFCFNWFGFRALVVVVDFFSNAFPLITDNQHCLTESCPCTVFVIWFTLINLFMRFYQKRDFPFFLKKETDQQVFVTGLEVLMFQGHVKYKEILVT